MVANLECSPLSDVATLVMCGRWPDPWDRHDASSLSYSHHVVAIHVVLSLFEVRAWSHWRHLLASYLHDRCYCMRIVTERQVRL